MNALSTTGDPVAAALRGEARCPDHDLDLGGDPSQAHGCLVCDPVAIVTASDQASRDPFALTRAYIADHLNDIAVELRGDRFFHLDEKEQSDWMVDVADRLTRLAARIDGTEYLELHRQEIAGRGIHGLSGNYLDGEVCVCGIADCVMLDDEDERAYRVELDMEEAGNRAVTAAWELEDKEPPAPGFSDDDLDGDVYCLACRREYDDHTWDE